MQDSKNWAAGSFGHAELGDARRTARLVELAAEVARRPAGTVMKACASSASREGAFRLLENDAVHPEAVRAAITTATRLKCRGAQQVVVPIDATSLHLTDNAHAKGIGGVGAWSKGARGVQVMTAVALTADGSALGVCAQRMWIRSGRSPYGRHGAQGKTSETRFWLELLSEVHRTFGETAPQCRPWFQMDRGADCLQVLELANEHDLLMTVRAAHDRRLDEGAARLWSTLQRAPVRAKRKVDVPARPPVQRNKRVKGKRIKVMTAPRRPRIATVVIRAATVPVECTTNGGRKFTATLNAVYVREANRAGDDRLEWLLLTTHPIRTRRDTLEVVRAYALRWRIEEFHRLWKTGLCRVEDTQLRSRDAIFKWATILAAVATRAMRITHLARETPDEPASTAFSPYELAALIALRQPKGIAGDHVPTLAVAVRWIADLGGYAGPWVGPPGAIVIGRGLYDVEVAARAFESRKKKR
jgi:Transposase DNA-binding/Transposase DDE domain